MDFGFGPDSLSLVFAAAWAVALCVAAGAEGLSGRSLTQILFMALGLFAAAFSPDLVWFWLGWEIAGLALWLPGGLHRQRPWLVVALHAPGVVLLLIGLLPHLAFSFTPPAGGGAQSWPAAVAAAFGVVALIRAGCPPFHAWTRELARASGGRGSTALAGIYALVGPYLLARALVAARWDALAIWLLALVGMVGLLGAVYSTVAGEVEPASALAPAHAAAAIAGFGLAPGSPLAATGAAALVLSGTLWVAAAAGAPRPALLRASGAWASLLGGSVGIWAVSQAALDLRYGVVAALLLPAGVALAPRATVSLPDQSRASPLIWAAGALLVLAGAFPQAVLEWVLRPVVGAMAGGVRALRGVSLDWGVGLQALALDEIVVAALPATGIAFGVFLALASLYWLKRLTARLQRMRDEA